MSNMMQVCKVLHGIVLTPKLWPPVSVDGGTDDGLAVLRGVRLHVQGDLCSESCDPNAVSESFRKSVVSITLGSSCSSNTATLKQFLASFPSIGVCLIVVGLHFSHGFGISGTLYDFLKYGRTLSHSSSSKAARALHQLQPPRHSRRAPRSKRSRLGGSPGLARTRSSASLCAARLEGAWSLRCCWSLR